MSDDDRSGLSRTLLMSVAYCASPERCWTPFCSGAKWSSSSLGGTYRKPGRAPVLQLNVDGLVVLGFDAVQRVDGHERRLIETIAGLVRSQAITSLFQQRSDRVAIVCELRVFRVVEQQRIQTVATRGAAL